MQKVRAVTHRMVDLARIAMPVSGTQIRADVHAHRAWLALQVYRHFVRRIVALNGTLEQRAARVLEEEGEGGDCGGREGA